MLSSVGNALRVLEELVDREEAGVSEIARALGLTVGTTHRLIGTLVDAGFAERNTNRRYRPGSKLPELARRMRGAVDVISIAHDHLERLMASAGQTVNLGVLRDDQVLYVDRVVTDQPLAVAVRIGSRVPAFCTGLGQALLAFGPDDVRDDYLKRLREIAAVDDRRAPSRKTMEGQLTKVRRAGYAEDDGAFSEDIGCLAAPVLDAHGRALAAISVSGLRSHVRDRRNELIEMVRQTAKEVSELVAAVGDDVNI